MSRELLQRVYESLGDWIPAKLRNDIKEELDKPQQKPLSDADILQIIDGGIGLGQFTLIDFARAIEKAHNIT